METDRESDLLTCKSKTSKEDLKKEQLKIEMENLPFPRDIVCLLFLFVARTSSLFLFVGLAVMVRRCFVHVTGTVVVSVCLPSSSTFESYGLSD